MTTVDLPGGYRWSWDHKAEMGYLTVREVSKDETVTTAAMVQVKDFINVDWVEDHQLVGLEFFKRGNVD